MVEGKMEKRVDVWVEAKEFKIQTDTDAGKLVLVKIADNQSLKEANEIIKRLNIKYYLL